ncbi:hypothetical protein [Streptomyces flavidovirens]|nr:hypothetical protein [Streptomyces flavidovirens]
MQGLSFSGAYDLEEETLLAHARLHDGPSLGPAGTDGQPHA